MRALCKLLSWLIKLICKLELQNSGHLQMIFLKLYGWGIFLLLTLLLYCSSTASQTAVKEIIFPQDSTFEINGISLEVPPKLIG